MKYLMAWLGWAIIGYGWQPTQASRSVRTSEIHGLGRAEDCRHDRTAVDFDWFRRQTGTGTFIYPRLAARYGRSIWALWNGSTSTSIPPPRPDCLVDDSRGRTGAALRSNYGCNRGMWAEPP